LSKKWKQNGDCDNPYKVTDQVPYNAGMKTETDARKLIAVVEDDPDQRHNYCQALTKKGFNVVAYGNRESAQQGFNKELPDLALLDIALGNDMDAGFDLCRALLVLSPTLPVIFLTERVAEIDQISGLRMGAWDYQTKPVSLGFLAERVASLLRLSAARLPDAETKTEQIGELTLNADALQVFWQEQLLDLTMTEYRMLEALLKHPGYAVSYDSLMQATMQNYVTRNTINTHMRNTRNKFRQLDEGFNCIKSEYGYGYRWIVPPMTDLSDHQPVRTDLPDYDR
jgi:two-component system OmpR family response regulator